MVEGNKAARVMAKRSDAFAISAFLVLVLAVWFGISALPSPGIVDLYGNAEYDLRDADFTDTVYAYNGDWQSYPEKLYTPEDFLSGKVPEAPVPSNTLDYESVQYATHTMELALPAGRTYGMFMRTANYSMRLFIDGREIDCVGVPGESRETTVPRVHLKIYVFTPETDKTTLIMQTANFVHREGAQAPRFVVGDYLSVQRRIGKEDTIAFLVAGCLLAAALYHLGLFALNRKRRAPLYFSLCCFLFMLIPNRIPLMFPEYNWQIVFRVEYFVHYAAFVCVLLFLDKLHPDVFHRPATRGYYIFAGLFIAALALPSTVFTKIFIVFEVVSIALMLYVFVMLTLMTLRRRKLQNLLSLVGLIVMGLFGLNDILMRFGVKLFGLIVGQGFTAPIGMIFFVFCYVLVIAIEYAETERNENRLATEAMALERANQLKTDLMRTISHEMRTPLAVIRGFAELTAEGARKSGMTGELLSNLDAIAAETVRMAALTEEMRQLALKKEYPKDRRPVDIGPVIRQITGLYAKFLEAKGTELETQIAEDLPLVFGNDNELTQVVFNLLRNADIHTQGGTITVKAEHAGEWVRVTVSDTGTGVAPELLPHIFERGVHGDNDGSGYGLAISQDIITAYGGEIWLESELGKGTRAIFTLPGLEGGESSEWGM